MSHLCLESPASHRVYVFLAVIFLAACAGPNHIAEPPRSMAASVAVVTPVLSLQAAADELFAADAAFSRASERTDLVSGLSAMFATDIVMPAPGGRFAEGIVAAEELLRSNPDNARSNIVWTPIGGGISADGQHGFTFGLMTLNKPANKPDKTSANVDTTANAMIAVPQKYLAYWVKQSVGWRVAVYRRTNAAGVTAKATTTANANANAAAAATDRMAPLLPQNRVMPSYDQAAMAKIKLALSETESAFSRDAQIIGIGPAFLQYGSGDAIHLGGAATSGLIIGPDAISKAVAADAPPTGSHVKWRADKVIAASSGDLGVTIGIIHLNKPPADGAKPVGFPFFTVWRRANADAPWRYVAE